MSDVKPVAYFVTGMPSGEPTLCFPDETEDCDVASDGRAKFLPLYSEGTITALQAEIEAMRKDAERYAWLRSRMPGAAYRVEGIIYSQGGSGVDAGIDAAIAKEKQP
jgi:hypothetical protein